MTQGTHPINAALYAGCAQTGNKLDRGAVSAAASIWTGWFHAQGTWLLHNYTQLAPVITREM